MNPKAGFDGRSYQTTCGGNISNPDQYPSAYFLDKQVFFCTLACKRAFELDPVRFMAGEIEHPETEE